jgi:fatty-acyl-CoA synthase
MVGDEGYVDEEGRFHLLGRGGGYVINTGGEKVYSEEVEEIIKSHPKVRDVAVIGIPDERWGEAVTAIVELNPGERSTEDEMREHCGGKMAGYKIPKNFVFHEVLRTDVGKIKREKMVNVAFKKLV